MRENVSVCEVSHHIIMRVEIKDENADEREIAS